jgi:hypothetical protein
LNNHIFSIFIFRRTNDFIKLIKKGIKALKTIAVKNTKIKVDERKISLFNSLGVSINIAKPNAITPLIEPAQNIIPFYDVFILKDLTPNNFII